MSEEDEVVTESTTQERLGAQRQLPPTQAGAWRSPRKEGFVVMLPSGNAARVKRTLDLYDLVKSGRIPNRLIKVVQKMMGDGKFDAAELSPETLDVETLQQMAQFIDVVATRVMIDPRCVAPPPGTEYPETWDPPEGCISIHDLTEEDKLFLFHVAQGGVADVEQFRVEQKAALAALQDVAEVQSATEQPAPA